MNIVKVILVMMMAVTLASEDHDHEESNSNVGPDKGITAVSETDGFKLSPEAAKNFDLKTVRITQNRPLKVPVSAMLYSGEEVNVYRLRDGFYKRIDLEEIKANDEIVVQGVGFLRTAELVVTGGAPEGHSH